MSPPGGGGATGHYCWGDVGEGWGELRASTADMRTLWGDWGGVVGGGGGCLLFLVTGAARLAGLSDIFYSFTLLLFLVLYCSHLKSLQTRLKLLFS